MLVNEMIKPEIKTAINCGISEMNLKTITTIEKDCTTSKYIMSDIMTSTSCNNTSYCMHYIDPADFNKYNTNEIEEYYGMSIEEYYDAINVIFTILYYKDLDDELYKNELYLLVERREIQIKWSEIMKAINTKIKFDFENEFENNEIIVSVSQYITSNSHKKLQKTIDNQQSFLWFLYSPKCFVDYKFSIKFSWKQIDELN